MRSLTHAEVRRAFVRCVLRSRTIPSLIRSDRGPEFKNALMAELSAMLGTEWRFSAPLRPCELGANERVHQEVQKVLGAVVRQVGASLSEAWSDWLVVAEYVIDNTPGPHGYTPRDLERSWSLALPLEKDVLRDALQFEPISDWARSQFKQFSELAAAVREHWTRSSEARAKLANRHRRTVDLKPGDRVVWNAPRARSEGAGRVPWKPGLTDAKDWDSVRADFEVYALAGEKVAEDPRRTEAYRDLVWSGLKIEPGPTRPGLTDADIAAVREVIRRKAAGFWVEDTTRTTVRKFAHDCIPTGPPVSSQPHSLRGESAQWVDDKLEEECKRGQLIRGSSAWGSAPFPTKEMPSYKRHRKRRLVVDYRRVNARIKRSTYYCRRGSDVLAAAVGSVWYTFVDAVSGFNQIRNTKRAREVLAIVARSGKYLPVGLTFGPINGPDDFNFVVDRAYAPGRGRRLKYTKEWIAYVDDLTVRTGRVIDGRFFTDAQAEGAVREACAKGVVAAPQSASSALEALGVRGAHNAKRANHDAARSDQNHPTRVLMLRMLGLFGCFCDQGGCFWGGPFPRSPVCGQKDFSSFVACSFVRLSSSQCLASRPRGSVQGRSRSRRSLRAQTVRKLPKTPPQRFKCVVEPRVGSPAGRDQTARERPIGRPDLRGQPQGPAAGRALAARERLPTTTAHRPLAAGRVLAAQGRVRFSSPVGGPAKPRASWVEEDRRAGARARAQALRAERARPRSTTRSAC